MKGLKNKLTGNEVCIFHTRLHKSMFLTPSLLIGMSFITPVFLLMGTGLLIVNLTKYYAQQYIITNQRVIIKNGLFIIRIKDISLNSIQNVSIHQTITDKILGSGSITIVGEQNSTSKFNALDRPYDFRHAIYSQLHAK